MENDASASKKILWAPWNGESGESDAQSLRVGENKKEASHGKAKRTLLVLALATFTTALQYCAVSGVGAAGGSAQNSTRVAVTVRDIQNSEILRESDFEFREITGEQCLSQMISEENKGILSKKMLPMALSAGTPIFQNAFVQPSTRRYLISQIPAGKSLYAFPVEDTALAASLRAGDRIDIVGHLQLPEKGLVTRTLVSGAIVAGVEVVEGSSTFFFFLERAEMEFLTHAKSFGGMTLVPRGIRDGGVDNRASGGMTQSRFLDDPRIRGVYEEDLFKIQSRESAK